MRAAYLTDMERAGLTVRDLLIAAGVTTLMLLVLAGLVVGANSKGLSALMAPDPLANAVELTEEQPKAEDVAMYVIDKNAEYAGL